MSRYVEIDVNAKERCLLNKCLMWGICKYCLDLDYADNLYLIRGKNEDDPDEKDYLRVEFLSGIVLFLPCIALEDEE